MTEGLAMSHPNGLDAYQVAARMLRDRVKDKSYRAYPLGQEAGEYLRWKRGRITASTYRDYESCLDKLAREYPDLQIHEFEPPVGTQYVEEFLDKLWGDSAPRTYNKNLSIVKDFFKWGVLKGKLHGDPALSLGPHKKRDVHREVFNTDHRAQILADGPDSEHLRRDRIALRLLLFFGIRKGTLRAIQFKHFDATRHKLTIFTKGQKVRELTIVDQHIWDDLAKLQFDLESKPHHYLMCRQKQIWAGYAEDGGSKFRHKQYPEVAMGEHGAHDWWYACLTRAGIVPQGTTRGEKMHKARHSAGQAVLDTTGNLKAAQKLLGHTDIATTGNIYADWDDAQLDETMRQVIGDD